MKVMLMIIMTYLRAWKGCRWSLRRTWEHERDADDHYDIPESMKGMPMIITTYLRAWKGCRWSLWHTWDHERNSDDHYDIPESMKGMPIIITTYLSAWKWCWWSVWHTWEHEMDADDHYDVPDSMKGMPMIIMTYLRAWKGCQWCRREGRIVCQQMWQLQSSHSLNGIITVRQVILAPEYKPQTPFPIPHVQYTNTCLIIENVKKNKAESIW